MFRNSLEGARDMYVLSSRDGGNTFTMAEKLGQGTWPLKACPMDGGGLAISDKGDLTTTWRREKQIYLATPGQAERQLGPGKDAAVVATPRGTYVAWTAGTGVRAILPGRSEPVELATQGGYAQLLFSQRARCLPRGRTRAD